MKILFYALIFFVLIFPIYLIKQSWYDLSNNADILYLIHRILGLYAFSLIFLQIILGSAMRRLNKLFPGRMFRIHKRVGYTAFTMATLHPILLYATAIPLGNFSYFESYPQGESALYYWIGIINISLLWISVLSAIFRVKIGPKWIYIHRINYLIFFLIFIHSLKLGVDTQLDSAKVVFSIYALIVLGLGGTKIFDWINSRRQIES